MKFKRIICISLMFIILFNTIICPISLAIQQLGPSVIYGPGHNSEWSYDWQDIAYQYFGERTK